MCREENRLYCYKVKSDPQLLRQVELPELAQEVYPLLGLFIFFIIIFFLTNVSLLGVYFPSISWKIVDPRNLTAFE